MGFRDAANEHFNSRIADRDLAQYRKTGAGVTTRLLRDLITEIDLANGALLDVGCGIGGLTFELLERGMSSAIAVEASPAYLSAATNEARRRGAFENIRFVEGDFLDLAAAIPRATVVTLDRVICCYPSYEPLLEESLRHAGRLLAFSYPRDTWYMRIAIAADNGIRRLRGRRFRTFIHPVDRMSHVIRRAGFDLAARRQTLRWSADVYVRASA